MCTVASYSPRPSAASRPSSALPPHTHRHTAAHSRQHPLHLPDGADITGRSLRLASPPSPTLPPGLLAASTCSLGLSARRATLDLCPPAPRSRRAHLPSIHCLAMSQQRAACIMPPQRAYKSLSCQAGRGHCNGLDRPRQWPKSAARLLPSHVLTQEIKVMVEEMNRRYTFCSHDHITFVSPGRARGAAPVSPVRPETTGGWLVACGLQQRARHL